MLIVVAIYTFLLLLFSFEACCEKNLFLELKTDQKLIKMARNFHRFISIEPLQLALF